MKPPTKFQWFYTLAADERLANGDKFVLAYIAFKSASPDDLKIRVRQTTVAENCATSDRQVRRAIGTAKQCGYMTLLTPRQRGRGYHGPDEYQLTIPENRTDTSAINGKIADIYAGNTGHIRPGIPDGEQLADLQDCSPKGFFKGFREGTAPASEAPPLIDVIPEEEQPEQPPDPEPDPYCTVHMPDGTDDKCGPCGTARTNLNGWRKRRDEAIRLCRLCDDRGGFGLRVGPFIKCPHDKKRIDELEAYHRARESA
jgi:hypothetical protein